MTSKQLISDRNPYLASLMASVQKGDEVAFSTLYAETKAFLFYVAFRTVQNRPLAEEIMQEAYVLAWKKAEKYHTDKGTVSTWLATITRNLSIDYLRKKQLTTVSVDEAFHIESEVASPYENYAEKNTSMIVSNCLAKLPENMKTAITLSYFKGHSYEEISTIMNAPKNTVKSWIRRGISRMGDTMVVPAKHLL